MGNLHAAAMAEAVGEGEVALRPALAWHLQSNHYPPVPTSMIDPCIAAIHAVEQDEQYREIELPEGITYKGHSTAFAADLIDSFHLGFFVEATLEGDNDYE